jgi:Icc-related predicted phosphoesterase
MIIAALTDIHGDANCIDRLAAPLAEADLVLLTGDLTHFGGASDAEAVVNAARKHNGSVRAVSGNCDRPDVEDWLLAEGIGLHAHHEIIDGIAFAGLGGSLPCPGHTPNEHSEGDLKRRLAEAVEGLDEGLPLVLVSHQPPFGTKVDVARRGGHVGSRSAREFIEDRRPLICFSGHIHEASGTDVLGETRLINPGPARGGRYAWAEVTDTVEVLEIR